MRARIVAGDGDPRHGVNGYTNLKCRCEICTEANAKAHANYMARHPDQQEKHRQRQRAVYARNRAAGLTSQGKPRKRVSS